MTDLIGLYKSGAFSKDEYATQETEQEQGVEQKDNIGNDKSVDFLKLLSDLEAGKNFFSEYINIILNRERQKLANKNFTLDDLYDNPERDKEKESRKEREEKFLVGRRKDFVNYVEIINQFVKVIGGQDE